MIRYSRACGSYQDFLERGRVAANREATEPRLLCCLPFFDLRILITSLVSSNSSCQTFSRRTSLYFLLSIITWMALSKCRLIFPYDFIIFVPSNRWLTDDNYLYFYELNSRPIYILYLRRRHIMYDAPRWATNPILVSHTFQRISFFQIWDKLFLILKILLIHLYTFVLSDILNYPL